MQELVFSPSDFVAVLNQTLEYAYPSVVIQGEMANLRVSKNRWVYFDLKDELSNVKFFGTVYQLPGPMEDGLMVQVRGLPRLHPQFGFSVNVQFMQPVGQGSIKKAAALLEAKLAAEGLFDAGRKRSLPYPPRRIGLITSSESAAYRDFTKIMNVRWSGVEILLADVQVQGEAALNQISQALEYFDSHAEPVDILVITRGGGSPDDLAVFNTEQITRAIAGSRVPTLVAIGHERDVSLAELAADQRASTPSNAAELLVPDKQAVGQSLRAVSDQLTRSVNSQLEANQASLLTKMDLVHQIIEHIARNAHSSLAQHRQLLLALSPHDALKRGYAILRAGSKVVRSGKQLRPGCDVVIELVDARLDAKINQIKLQ
jgi:exodeoxyribonuclease VII large subunit